MDKLRQVFSKPLVIFVAGLVVGLIIGLPILGWMVFPVEWTDASASDLRMDLKEDYLRMAIQAYSLDKDGDRAVSRYKEIGLDAKSILDTLSRDPKLNSTQIQEFGAIAGAVVTLPQAQPQTGVAEGTPQAGATSVPLLLPTVEPKTREGISPILLLVVFCGLMLVIGAALVYVLVLRKGTRTTKQLTPQPVSTYPIEPEETLATIEQEVAVGQFVTTYQLGDDSYDDSFSVDAPNGEFLGECGSGISDIIGVGSPKKVTALEVWLFDKNDIQTVTKVLMSEHAFNDQTIRQRLMSKGEPILMRPNERILLETEALQMEAKLVDMAYGQSALPPNSYFDHVSIELTVWRKM